MQDPHASPYLTVNKKYMKLYSESKKGPSKMNQTQAISLKKTQTRCISINFDFVDKFTNNPNYQTKKQSMENNDEILQYSDRVTPSNFPNSILEPHKYNGNNRIEINKPKILRKKVNHYNSEFYNPNINLSNTNKREKILSIIINNGNFENFKNKFLTKEREKLTSEMLRSSDTLTQDKEYPLSKSKIFHPSLGKNLIAKKCINSSSQDSYNIKRKNSLHDQINDKLFVTEKKDKNLIENNEEDAFNKKIAFNPSGTSFFPKLSQKIFNYKLLKMPFGKHKIIPNVGTQTMIFQKLKMKSKTKKIKTEEIEVDLFYKH